MIPSTVSIIEYASADERWAATMRPYEEWITKQLGGINREHWIRFNGPHWMNALRHFCVRKRFAEHITDVSLGSKDSVAALLGSYVVSVECNPDYRFHKVTMDPGQKNGQHLFAGRETLISVSFKDLRHKIIMSSVSVGTEGSWTTYNEYMCAERDFAEVWHYFQSIERMVKRLTIETIDGSTDTVRPISWDAVILDPTVKFMVKNDLESFLSRKEWFQSKGLPYRRGYLLHGPPGNGKTTVIRAMMTTAELPTYTMKNYFRDASPDNFEEMFHNSARVGGAIVVLEDIDRCFATKGTDKDSAQSQVPFSTFLNCLDGVSEAEGLIVIATANNPKVLDSAILQRPGRFDRVVPFLPPSDELKVEYFKKLNVGISDNKFKTLLPHCEGMSFAQLREIYIMATQLADDSHRTLDLEDMISASERLAYNIRKSGGSGAVGF